MAQETFDFDIKLPIKNGDGSSFHDLALHKYSVESVVMSLGDKITGDVYYPNNSLSVSMQEYVEYKGVKYVLVSPPTIVREGLVKDNGELKGMTKYSFVFYHPMYMLGNLPFTDVAVTQDQERYLSESKTFSWIGTGYEFIDKLNKNLQNTQWVVVASTNPESAAKLAKMPSEVQVKKAGEAERQDVLSFDKAFISDALKNFYENWEVPFIIDTLEQGEYTYTDGNNNVVDYYDEGKRFVVLIGLPSNEILDENDQPFVFQLGQGLGLKNNSRNPKNNKIITRIVGYGAERNIPYGYPQIVWTGDQTWGYTVNNDPSATNSYPIYDGIVGGRNVKLIKHPFTRKNLMPSVYSDAVNKKVNPLATGYDPTIELKDYYDAPNNYPNPVNALAPSVEVHQFENEYPRLNENTAIVAAAPYDGKTDGTHFAPVIPMWNPPYRDFGDIIDELVASTTSEPEKAALREAKELMFSQISSGTTGNNGGSYTYSVYIDVSLMESKRLKYIQYTSGNINFAYNVYMGSGAVPAATWDDSMDADGNYRQSYFIITLPQLDNFDLYACASITEEMNIVMRSGNCLGCTFPIMVDWDDYKANFFHTDGTFDPVPHTQANDGHVRDLTKYPDTSQGQVDVIVQKDLNTFGTLMPNQWQIPVQGDKIVFTGISLPLSYITNAEANLDATMMEYMLENNVHYFDYPLKFDEHFLVTHTNILEQMRNNTIVRFRYAGINNALYIKQIAIKYGDAVLPQYDITLTDDVEVVLNQIGQVTDDVSRIRVQLNELQKYYGEDIVNAINEKLSRVADDIAQGRITFQQGLDALGSTVFHDEVRSPQYETGLYTGRGWRIDNLGNAEMESLRVRSFLEIVELLVNRMQAQEGDTMFTDNDQIDMVTPIYETVTPTGTENPSTSNWYERSGTQESGYTYTLSTDTQVDTQKTYYAITSYILSFKEKWNGYVTSQVEGNILKGIMNTLAAKQAGISDVEGVPFFTSWMRVVETSTSQGGSLGVNQVRVVLYSDNETPAGTNYVPCELMSVARWGSSLDPNEQGISAAEKARRKALRSVFYISTNEGRIVKLNNVRRPILESTNYGTTIGELPDFVKAYPSVAQRLVDGGDYLYAQGIVVSDFIKVDRQGNPIINYVDKGEWATNTVYLHEEYNEDTKQYETHDVWHNNALWRCLQHQPVTIQGVSTYYEPTDAHSDYWKKLMEASNGESAFVVGIDNDMIAVECDSTGEVIRDTTIPINISAYYGSTSVINACTITDNHEDVDNDVDVVYDPDDTGHREHIAVKFWEGNAHNRILIFTFTIVHPTYGTRTIGLTINPTKRGADGADGERGKRGRFYYYAGMDWSDNPNKSFNVTDAEAPYFSYTQQGQNTQYWIFNPAQNGTYTMRQMGEPSSSNENWELMTNDFKYIISEAIFANFAKMASFLFKGVWMMSEQGKMGYLESTDSSISYITLNGGGSGSQIPYLLFDENHPDSSYEIKCQPCYASDDTEHTPHSITVTAGNEQVLASNLVLDTDSLYMLRFAEVEYAKLYLRTSNNVDWLIGGNEDIISLVTQRFKVPESGIYSLVMKAEYSGHNGTVSENCVLTREIFMPNFVVNSQTGAVYQQNSNGLFKGRCNFDSGQIGTLIINEILKGGSGNNGVEIFPEGQINIRHSTSGGGLFIDGGDVSISPNQGGFVRFGGVPKIDIVLGDDTQTSAGHNTITIGDSIVAIANKGYLHVDANGYLYVNNSQTTVNRDN